MLPLATCAAKDVGTVHFTVVLDVLVAIVPEALPKVYFRV